MSQEEIESLMNGLDFGSDDIEEDSTEEKTEEKVIDSNEKMSEDDINELIAQTEDIISEEKKENSKVSDDDINELLAQVDENNTKDDNNNDESLDELLNSFEDNSSSTDTKENIQEELDKSETLQEDSKEEQNSDNDEDIDQILKEIENEDSTKEDLETSDEASDESIDDLLASIDGITDDDSNDEEFSLDDMPPAKTSSKDNDIKDIDDKINKGLFPLPVEDDTKVVNQLSIVANDSEEKATKIFDVLSNILDYNTEIQNDVQALATFNDKQLSMLSSLSKKFPNINAFKQNLEQSELMNKHIQDINEKLNLGNTEIFQAMELMQYHDINRQKIERVMSVIRKLSTYLNNLFEDAGNHSEVAVAKHIHGDKGTDDLMAEDDLEALIAEFNK
jgi:hypothetical protein